MGGVLYLVVILLETGIFTSHWIWLLRTRKQRKAQRDVEKAGGSPSDVSVGRNSNEDASRSVGDVGQEGENTIRT
jgi:hypothetical protein